MWEIQKCSLNGSTAVGYWSYLNSLSRFLITSKYYVLVFWKILLNYQECKITSTAKLFTSRLSSKSVYQLVAHRTVDDSTIVNNYEIIFTRKTNIYPSRSFVLRTFEKVKRINIVHLILCWHGGLEANLFLNINVLSSRVIWVTTRDIGDSIRCDLDTLVHKSPFSIQASFFQ